MRPGQCNYDQLSEAVSQATSVCWPGRLRLRPEGYPALVLPADWPAVAATPYDWTQPAGQAPSPQGPTPVPGEILRLRDTPQLRQRLDDFEGFTPRVRDYLRVACAWQGQWVWTYVAPADRADWPYIERWPASDQPIPPWRGGLK